MGKEKLKSIVLYCLVLGIVSTYSLLSRADTKSEPIKSYPSAKSPNELEQEISALEKEINTLEGTLVDVKKEVEKKEKDWWSVTQLENKIQQKKNKLLNLKSQKNRASEILEHALLQSEIDKVIAEADIVAKMNRRDFSSWNGSISFSESGIYIQDQKLLKDLLSKVKEGTPDDFQQSRNAIEKRLQEVTHELSNASDEKQKDSLTSRKGTLEFALLAGSSKSTDNGFLSREHDWSWTKPSKPPLEDLKEKLEDVRKERDDIIRLKEEGLEEEARKKAESVQKDGGNVFLGLCSDAGEKIKDGWAALTGAGRKDWGLLGKAASGVGEAASAVPTAAGGIASALWDNSGAVKTGLYTIFSAMAQYQYTQKGSRSAAGEMYRGLAIGLGLDMTFKKEMPEALMGQIDPLTPYKSKPLGMQAIISAQDQVLKNVLTIGGNPAEQAAYPYGTHDRLQRILTSSVPGGGFPGRPIFDPSYQNFVGRAYNGFPPMATTSVQGAYLNPQFGSNIPFIGGSAISSSNFYTQDALSGQRAVANLAAAAQAQRMGIENFANQMNNINPPSNSLVDLIDGVGRANAQQAALTAGNNMLDQMSSNPNVDFFNNLLIQQYALLNEQYRNLSDINKEIWEASQQFRQADLLMQRDEDGLIIGGPKYQGRHMRQRGEALNKLQELKNKRAQALEKVALIQSHPAIYYRMITNVPRVAVPNTLSSDQPRSFFIRNAWAQEKTIGGIHAFAGMTLLPNWKDILKEEKNRIRLALSRNQTKLKELWPQLKALLQLDPDGVHEINLEVLYEEELNMKSIAFQADQNLEKLKKSEENLDKDPGLTPEARKKTQVIIQEYQILFNRLRSEANRCAAAAVQVEKLQIKKVDQFEEFHHFKSIGEKMLLETPSL